MSFHWIIPLFAALASLGLTILVIRKGPRTELSQVFAFLATMLVFWNLTFFILYSVSDHDLASSLARVLRVGSFFLQPAILHLFLVLQTQPSRFWRNVLIGDYAIACGLVLVNAVDLFVSDLRSFQWGYYSVGTGFYNLFAVFLLANFVGAFALLAHGYYTSTQPRMRLQLRFWLLAALVALPLGLTNLLPVYGIPFYPLGNLGSAAWAGIVAYAIVRHRLMDVDLVVTKGMAYGAVSLVLIAPSFALMLWLQQRSFGHIHPDFSFAMLAIVVAVGLLFPTLRIRAESRFERSLFGEKHAYRSTLAALTRSIVRILDRDRLIRELATTLFETMRLDRIVVALLNEPKGVFTICHALGVPTAASEFARDHALVESLARRQEVVLRDELETSSDDQERTMVADVCRRNGWEVCIPLTVGNQLIGFINLGRKRNLDAFFADDLELLGTLAAEASIALENARLYDELKRSNDIIRRADRLSALGTLAAGIAHEVRNPLVSIQTFFQLAPERLHDEEFFTTFLGITASEVTRISDLITELLTFARSPTRALRPMDLNEAVDRVSTLLEAEARKHNLRLTRTLAPDLALVTADSDQIKQVLINLVLNAIQATPAGGAIAVTTRTLEQQQQVLAQIEIRDTGPGIPPDQIDHIFDPFFTTKDKGTGLGLAIVHQIVAEHGGSISVESGEARGTSFFVNLPAHSEPAVDRSAPDIGSDAESSKLHFVTLRKVAS